MRLENRIKENIITGIHFNNTKDNQKLKHGGKYLKIARCKIG